MLMLCQDPKSSPWETSLLAVPSTMVAPVWTRYAVQLVAYVVVLQCRLPACVLPHDLHLNKSGCEPLLVLARGWVLFLIERAKHSDFWLSCRCSI